MITLHRDGNLKISIYADHNPPHFHVETPDGKSLVEIATLAEMRGNAPRKMLAKAIEWALQNRARIEIEWNRLNPPEG